MFTIKKANENKAIFTIKGTVVQIEQTLANDRLRV